MSLGGGEVFTQLCDGSGGAAGGQRVEPDGQGAVAGVDVAAAGQSLADEGVCFVVGAGVAGVDADVSGQGGGGVERGDADGVADQLGLDVQDLLAGVDLGQRKSGRDGPVGALGGVQVGLCCAEVCGQFVVVGVGDQYRLAWWRGYCVQQGRIGGGQGPVVAGPGGQDLLVGFLLGRGGGHPGRVILRGGVGVVGVEVEVHPGVG